MKAGNGFRRWFSGWNFNSSIALGLIAFSVFTYLVIPYQIAKPSFAFSRRFMTLPPTLFPQLASLALLVLSLMYLIRSPRLQEENLLLKLTAPAIVRMAVTLVVLALYVYFLEFLGFLVSTPLCLAALTLYYGNRDWRLLIFVIILFPLGLFYLFDHFLRVPLPQGDLF